MNSTRPLSMIFMNETLSGRLQEWSQEKLGLYLSESSKKEKAVSNNKQQKIFNAILTALTYPFLDFFSVIFLLLCLFLVLR